jgi:hypothetical protein
VKYRLQLDLEGVTTVMLPPQRPESARGYFELTEGQGNANTLLATDSTVGDIDDVLMFTTRSSQSPFVGKFGATSIESNVAEVAWFVRGRTLYRRVLLVAPGKALAILDTGPPGPNGILEPGEVASPFYNYYDLSVRRQGVNLVPNTLSDLTRPECRFAHWQLPNFASHPHRITGWAALGLPTLRECSAPGWVAGAQLPVVSLNPRGTFDAWNTPHPWEELDEVTGTLNTPPNNFMGGSRIAEDVILNNVIGFDVKVWDAKAPVVSSDSGNEALVPGDPGYPDALGKVDSDPARLVSYGAYVDLGYGHRINVNYSGISTFSGPGDPRSRLIRVYDTWSFHYEHDGQDQNVNNLIDEGTNGFDDNNDGAVDDYNELEMPPPYPYPLRGIQIKIRAFEPDSRQIREVTVVVDFVPE